MKALDVIKKTMQAEVKPTIAQQAKQTSSSENPTVVKPTLNPVVSATPTVATNPNPAPTAKPTQTAAPADSKAAEEASWWDMINNEPETSPEEQAKIEKRKRAIHNIASIGDAIASVSNLAAATQGAQSAYNPATNLTDAARARYETAEALRQKNLAIRQAKWQDKMKAISDRTKFLQEQEAQRAEEEYRNKQYAAALDKQEEVRRSNLTAEEINRRKLEQEQQRIAQDDKTIAAAVKKSEADAYEARARGDSYKEGDKSLDFVVGNESIKIPANLFGNNTVGRSNLYQIFEEVVSDADKAVFNDNLIQQDVMGNKTKKTPSVQDLEYWISRYGDPAKMKTALDRITGKTPSSTPTNKYQTTKSGGLKLD